MKCSRSFKTHKHVQAEPERGSYRQRLGNVSLEGKEREALRKETEVETLRRGCGYVSERVSRREQQVRNKPSRFWS